MLFAQPQACGSEAYTHGKSRRYRRAATHFNYTQALRQYRASGDNSPQASTCLLFPSQNPQRSLVLPLLTTPSQPLQVESSPPQTPQASNTSPENGFLSHPRQLVPSPPQTPQASMGMQSPFSSLPHRPQLSQPRPSPHHVPQTYIWGVVVYQVRRRNPAQAGQGKWQSAVARENNTTQLTSNP